MYIHIYIYVSYAYFRNVYTCVRNICVHIVYIHVMSTPKKKFIYVYT